MAGSSSVFGLSEMALRLPTAILGITAVVLQFFAGRYLGGRGAGVLAAILLLGVAQFVAYSRLAMMDVPLVAFGMLTVVCLLYGERRPVMTLVAGVAFGLAVLTKSVAALLFVPGLLAIVVARRGLRFLWSRELMLAAALALAIALPWHVVAVATHGRSFLDQYIFHHVLARYFRPIHGEDSSFSYFILYRHNAGVFAPIHAAGLAIALLLAAVKRDRLLAALVLFPVAAFIVVNGQATKFGWYLTPVYPGAALAAALGITHVLRNDQWRPTAIALAALLAAPGVINGRGVFVEQYNILDYSPEVRALQHAPPFIKGRAPVLYTLEVAHPAPRFYLADHVQPVDEEELARLVAQKQPFLCLTWKHAGVELTRKYSDSVRIVASTESLAVIRNA
jgi:4-amino-4-deoxy-L-arabinose transferase-like glycosyltransferase